MNKRGIEMLNYPIWILRFMFLTVLIIAIGFMVTKYINTRLIIAPIETPIIAQRIAVSPALMYQDKVTHRITPAIVDTQKITDTKALTQDIPFDTTKFHIAARIIAENVNKKTHLNKRLFEDLQEQVGGIFGTDIYKTKQTYQTFVYDKGELKQDKLTIEVLQQT
ncbi:hypothetical protein HY485_05075 [Candidatus Woesearchaeota archaeon]|nr:hypothetical protein [Candidatus Woesearchaeota archaeon]